MAIKTGVKLSEWKMAVNKATLDAKAIKKLKLDTLNKTSLAPFELIHTLATDINQSISTYKIQLNHDGQKMIAVGENKKEDDHKGALGFKK